MHKYFLFYLLSKIGFKRDLFKYNKKSKKINLLSITNHHMLYKDQDKLLIGYLILIKIFKI